MALGRGEGAVHAALVILALVTAMLAAAYGLFSLRSLEPADLGSAIAVPGGHVRLDRVEVRPGATAATSRSVTVHVTMAAGAQTLRFDEASIRAMTVDGSPVAVRTTRLGAGEVDAGHVRRGSLELDLPPGTSELVISWPGAARSIRVHLEAPGLRTASS